MPTIGDQLRIAREEQNWTVSQVAEATKIKTDHVRALVGEQHGREGPGDVLPEIEIGRAHV